MKKILIFASILGLSACRIHAGNIDVLPQRNAFFNDINSYPIQFFNNETMKLVKTEKVSDVYPKKNEIHRVYTGYSVFYNKTYIKRYYQDCLVKANQDGSLNGGSVPSLVYKKDTKKLLGRSFVDNKWYSLLPSNEEGYVWLIEDDGKIAGKMGEVKDGRLIVLDSVFVPSPANLSFEILKETKLDQSIPATGFDIKYSGIKLGQLSFTVLDYSKYSKDRGEFEVFYFENKPNTKINIMGTKIKITSADEQKIDYVILGY